MFFFFFFLSLGMIGLFFGVRALRRPNSWPFNRTKDELHEYDMMGIKFRGVFLLAFGTVLTIASFRLASYLIKSKKAANIAALHRALLWSRSISWYQH